MPVVAVLASVAVVEADLTCHRTALRQADLYSRLLAAISALQVTPQCIAIPRRTVVTEIDTLSLPPIPL